MNYTKTLERLLSETKEETHFDYNGAFNPRNYLLPPKSFNSLIRGVYIPLEDKIIINPDVFESLNKKLTLKTKGENGEEKIIQFRDIVDFPFIKNLIKHEEAHRQVDFLNLEHYGPHSNIHSHNEVFFYVLNLLGGYIPEVYINGEGITGYTTYYDLRIELNCRDIENLLREKLNCKGIKLSDVFFINKNCTAYSLHKDLAKKIENYAKSEKPRDLIIFDKDKSIKLRTSNGMYHLNFDLDFNKNEGIVY